MVRTPSAIRFVFAVTLCSELCELLKDTSAEQMLAVVGLES